MSIHRTDNLARISLRRCIKLHNRFFLSKEGNWHLTKLILLRLLIITSHSLTGSTGSSKEEVKMWLLLRNKTLIDPQSPKPRSLTHIFPIYQCILSAKSAWPALICMRQLEFKTKLTNMATSRENKGTPKVEWQASRSIRHWLCSTHSVTHANSHGPLQTTILQI